MTDMFTAAITDAFKTAVKPIAEFSLALNPVGAYLKQLNTGFQSLELFTRSNIEVGKVNKIFGEQLNKVGGNYAENLKQFSVNYEAGIRNNSTNLLQLQKELRQTGVDTQKSTLLFAELNAVTGGNIDAMDQLAATIMRSSDEQGISISKFLEGMAKITDKMKNLSTVYGDPLMAQNISVALQKAFPQANVAQTNKILDYVMSLESYSERLSTGLQERVEQIRTADPETMVPLLQQLVSDALNIYSDRFSQTAGLGPETRALVLGDRLELFSTLQSLMKGLKALDVYDVAKGTGEVNTIVRIAEDMLSKTTVAGTLGSFIPSGILPNQLNKSTTELAMGSLENMRAVFESQLFQQSLGSYTQILTGPANILMTAISTLAPQTNILTTNFQSANTNVNVFNQYLVKTKDALNTFATNIEDFNKIYSKFNPIIKTGANTQSNFEKQVEITSNNLKQFIDNMTSVGATIPKEIQNAYERLDTPDERRIVAENLKQTVDKLRDEYFVKLQQAAASGDRQLFEARFIAMQSSLNNVINIIGGYMGVPGLGSLTGGGLGSPPMGLISSP